MYTLHPNFNLYRMSEIRKNTMVELVDELTKRNKDGKFDQMINDAKTGEYHDYKNKKYDFGKVAFVTHASVYPELADLVEDVKKGVYDEVADADDKAMMIQDLKDNCSSPQEVERMIKMLGLDK